MPVTFDVRPNFSNHLVPWRELIEFALSRIPNCSDAKGADVRPLSGGLSGAVLAAIFPQGDKFYSPVVAKIDTVASIENEFKRYMKYLYRHAEDYRIARLLFPSDPDSLPRIEGADLREYSIIAYSYAADHAADFSKVLSFDEICSELVKAPQEKGTRNRQHFNNAVDLLEATLNSFFYSQKSVPRAIRPFDIPNIPWETFLPLAETTSCLFHEWNRFVTDLPSVSLSRLSPCLPLLIAKVV